MAEGQSTPTYYTLLNLHPSASPQEIRRAYRELSKLYHPDTTALPKEAATAKFQQLNEAYATLSNPEKRVTYDLKIGYSRAFVIQSRPDFNRPVSSTRPYKSNTYLDPTDRPLSAGELFALLMIGVTFAVCLLVAIIVGLTRGETALQTLQPLDSGSDVINTLSLIQSNFPTKVIAALLTAFPI